MSGKKTILLLLTLLDVIYYYEVTVSDSFQFHLSFT